MAIVRHAHRHPATLAGSLERFFNDSMWGQWDDGLSGRDWMPAVDVAEDENGFTVKAELPGIAKEDVEVQVKDNVLTIRGEKKEEIEEKDKQRYRMERRYGSFERSFHLPDNADVDAIKATHKNGVLSLNIPKKAEAQPQKIDISID